MQLFLVLILSCMSGIMYRLGGAKKPGKWYDALCESWIRDCGCSLLTTLAIGIQTHWSGQWWMYLAHFGMLYGALSTYWKFLNHKEDTWWTWAITGLGYAVPAVFFCFGGLSVLRLLLRCLLLALFTSGWRRIWSKDVVEEVGSGVSIPLSTLLL